MFGKRVGTKFNNKILKFLLITNFFLRDLRLKILRKEFSISLRICNS